MRIRVLGMVGVQRGTGHLDPLRATKPASVLAMLAIHSGDVVREAALAEALWAQTPPPSARTALQTYVSQVRSFLQPDRPRRSQQGLIATAERGYRLTVPRDGIDAGRFERLVEEARRMRPLDPAAATAMVEEALALWQPPLGHLADQPWAVAFTSRLEEVHRAAVEERFALALLTGRHEEIIEELRPAIAADPYRERLVGQLMLALHRCGRRGEALAVFTEARDRLVGELGMDPGHELTLLQRAILSGDRRLNLRGDSDVEAAPTPVPLPRHTLVVGRRDELAALRAAVTDHRLVTLVGPGGAGKTRLVQQLLAVPLPDVGRRTWFVDLGTVGSDEEVLTAVGRVLHLVEHPLVPLAQQLVAAAGTAPGLVVLDTCEHVMAGAAQAAEALLRNPAVTVLCTSRRRLQLQGEHTMRLRPLSMPASDDPDAARASDAVQLLCRRADLDDPDDADLVHLGRISRRLDGLPLALELAAPRIRSVGIAELAATLDRDLDVLAPVADGPARHRTMRAAVRWSTDLLDDVQRRVLVQVAPFAGPFTAAMATHVVADAGRSVLQTLAALVDASLLSVESPDPLRYRVLDTVRAVARTELADPATREQARQRHTDWVLATVDAAHEADRHMEPPAIPLTSIADEIEAALEHLETRPGDPRHLALVGGLPLFYRSTGRLSEGRTRIDRALTAADPAAHPHLRAAALGAAAYLAFYQGSFTEGAALAEDAAAVAQALGRAGMTAAMQATAHIGRGEWDAATGLLEKALIAYDRPGRQRLILLDMAANLAWYSGDHAEALTRFRDAAALAAQVRNDALHTQALRGQGVMMAYLGDPERGWGLCSRSLQQAGQQGDGVGVTQAHAACAATAEEAGAHDDAMLHAREVLRRSVPQFDVFALLLAVPVLALRRAEEGSAEAATRLVGWYRSLLDATGVHPSPRSDRQIDQAAERGRRTLGRATAARLQAEGAATGVAALADA